MPQPHLQPVFLLALLHVLICILIVRRCTVSVSPPGIIKLSSYPQRALQNLSVASCFEVASPLSVVRLHRDARHGDLWERGVPLLAVVQPAGLRAVGAQRQGGSAHL